MSKEGKYSGPTTWLLIAIWTIIVVWVGYIAYEHLNWNGGLWVAMIVTYGVILFVIIAYSDVEVQL